MNSHSNRLLARLRFRHLQLLVHIEQSGSLSKAARMLSLTQPALSKALKELEAMLGFPLFTRGTHGLQKTKQGRIIIHGAALLLRELHHIKQEAELAGASGQISAVLRLGTPAYLAVNLIPKLIECLANRAPPLIVNLQEDNVPGLFRALINAELDALITVYSPEALSLTDLNNLCFEKIGEEAYAVIASANGICCLY